HFPAAAHGELDILPLQSGIAQCGADRVRSHLHRRLALEAAEGMQADTDDRDIVGHGKLLVVYSGRKAKVSTSLPSASVPSGTVVRPTRMPNCSFCGSFSVSLPSTRMTSPSCTSPTPNGTNVFAVSLPR